MTNNTYAGSIEFKVEKKTSKKLYTFLEKIHGQKPELYDYGIDDFVNCREQYTKATKEFEEGKMKETIPLFKLARHSSEVFHEVVRGTEIPFIINSLLLLLFVTLLFTRH